MPTAMPVEPLASRLGKRGGQHHRLFLLAVIGGAEIDRVLVDAVQQRLRGLGQAAFGVAHGGGVIAVDIAEIALAFDQRIAHGEILRQAHQGVIDRTSPCGWYLPITSPTTRAHFLKPAAGLRPSSRMA